MKGSCFGARTLPPVLAALAFGMVVSLSFAVPASARRVARYDPIEPLFTERAFLDHSAELGVEWSKDKGSQEVEIAAGLEWIFWDWLELDAEIPGGINIPNHGSTKTGPSDIGFAAQVLVCCKSHNPFDFLSLRAAVDAPTGNRSKGIGGDGDWEVSVIPGRYFTIMQSLPDLLAQLQLSYTQQIRLDDDSRETASELGLSKTRKKAFVWNLALAQPYFDGIFQPVFEILGTTVVDAVDDDDQGTIVELSGGFWFAPHPKEHWLSALSYGFAFKAPVTSLKEDQSVAFVVIEWAL